MKNNNTVPHCIMNNIHFFEHKPNLTFTSPPPPRHETSNITDPTPFHELPTLLHPEEKWQQFLIIKLMVNRKVISSIRASLHKAMAPIHKFYSKCHYWIMQKYL
jgi:hypothetical protein